MKPAPFAYEAPRSIAAALALLDDDTRPLAGGQSLVPMLNFRLASPARLVDLNLIEELSYLRRGDDGSLRIGAMTRQASLERSALVQSGWPLLRQAVRLVAHAAIRSRGTVGGSVAHGDPAAELAVALLALGARFSVSSLERGDRSVEADQMFLGPLTTALESDELLIEIVVPALPEGVRTAFAEHARTHGDFALAGAAVVLAGPGGDPSLALLGAGPVPVRALVASRALAGGAGVDEVAALAAEGVEDSFRRALVCDVVRRAILMASSPASSLASSLASS